MTEKQRNKLLAEMTDEVGLLVLQDNYYQTQALSVAGRGSAALLDGEARQIRWLERAGRLNRALEFLPGDEEIAERKAASEGLTSPERAVLLAYSKMWLYDELVASDVPEDTLVAGLLVDYFPVPLRQRYGEAMHRHPLRREILATHLTNLLVNRIGATFVHRMMEETDARPADIVRACLIARDVFGLTALWQDIDALDNRVPDAEQARMFAPSASCWSGPASGLSATCAAAAAPMPASRGSRRRPNGLPLSCPQCCRSPTLRRWRNAREP